MSEDYGTQALWPQMIAVLAAIDDALGLPQDGCNSTGQTLHAIRGMKVERDTLRAELIKERNAHQSTLDDANEAERSLRDENAKLQKIADAAENLILQKGRHNTEIAYRRLADALAGRKGQT